MKQVIKDIGENARATTMDGLLGLANWVGLGSAGEGLIRRIFGKKELPTSAEVESIVNQILTKAKALNNAEITKLQNKLADLPLVKSSLQKEVIDKKVTELRNQLLKRQATTDLADDIANSAMNTAANISYATASERKGMAKEAEEKATKAAQMYQNAGDPSKVEQNL